MKYHKIRIAGRVCLKQKFMEVQVQVVNVQDGQMQDVVSGIVCRRKCSRQEVAPPQDVKQKLSVSQVHYARIQLSTLNQVQPTLRGLNIVTDPNSLCAVPGILRIFFIGEQEIPMVQ